MSKDKWLIYAEIYLEQEIAELEDYLKEGVPTKMIEEAMTKRLKEYKKDLEECKEELGEG